MVSTFRKWWKLPVIAGVFVLLAAFVMSQEAVEKQPRIVILFDVSDSMNTIDGPEQPGRDPTTLPTRQDQVLRFLGAVKKGTPNTFLDELLKKAPVTAYRFGATPDHLSIAQFEAGKSWSADEWSRWLRAEPKNIDLRSGTNIAGSALEMLYAEKDSYIQAIIIVSDGRGTRATREEIDDFLEEVRDPRRPIPVITVGVGDPRTLPSIRLHELQAPRNVRPDDKFIVRVPIEGRGLAGEEFQVMLEAQRLLDAAGKPVARAKRYLPGPKIGKFTGSAIQYVDYALDAPALGKDIKDASLAGTWRFVARTTSHPREAFNGAEHVSEPIDVVVQDRKIRVLLFSGGPTREYQFLRTLFYREALENRLDLSILLQNSGDGVDADPNLKRILKTFPNNLASFDVIVSLDPDWSAVGEKQSKLLAEWVALDGGSVIFAAGPVYTYQFARPNAFGIGPLLSLMPVVLRDSRLHGSSLPSGAGHDASRPHPLHFAPNAKQFPFLKLDDAGNSPTAGWDAFFWGPNAKPAPDAKPVRGFYSYYPVERLKPAAEVIATFGGPKESRIGDKTDAFKDQQPYFVRMRHGSGMTWYLGGQETWRLRQYREEFQARFWTGLIHFTAAPARGLVQKHVQVLMSRNALVGSIPLEALVLNKDRMPLDDDKLKAEARHLSAKAAAPIVFDVKAKEAGRFAGSIKLAAPGDYEIRIAIPGTTESLSHRVKVRAADREADDDRVDFARLFELAGDAKPLLAKLPADVREEVDAALRASEPPGAERRLYFRLSEAHTLPALLEKLSPKPMPKRDAPRKRPETKSAHDQVRKLEPTNVLIIDGAGPAGRKEGGDSYHVQNAIAAFRNGPYKVHYGDIETGAAAVKALERDDLARYGVILLLNVHELNGKQIANLEAFAKTGGGVAFFMGPLVNAGHYNKHLFKAGKGIFPVPLAQTFYPAPNEKPLDPAACSEGLIVRDDLVPKGERIPIFGEIFLEPQHRLPLSDFSLNRYFKIARADWRPEVNRSFELATLPNFESIGKFEQAVAQLTRGSLNKLHADKSFKLYRTPLGLHIKAIDALALPGSDAKAYHLAAAFDAMLRDRGLLEFWKDARVRPLFAEIVNLHRHARLGDPLIVGGQFGKGRTIAVMTTAGKKWTEFPAGSMSSMLYAPFINEMLDHLSGQEPPPPEFVPELPRQKRSKNGPRLLDVAPLLEPRLPLNKNDKKDEGPVYLVTPDAIVPCAGSMRDDVGVRKAHWIVQVEPGQDRKPEPELRVPLTALFAQQHRRALDEAINNVLRGAKDKPFPTGVTTFHSLAGEPGFDFKKHLGRLKGKGEVQPMHLVKIWLMAEGGDPAVVVRSEKPMLFLVASENEVLAQTMAPLEKIAACLESAQDSLRGAEDQLAEQGNRLKDPAANREVIALRVEEVARAVQHSMTGIRESAVAAERIRRQLESNRVNKAQHDRAFDLVIALDALTHGPNLRGVEDALSALSAGMGKGNADQLRRHMEEARLSLKSMNKDTEKVLNSLVESCTELKLISLLREIERRQADHTRELERIQRLLIDELLKKK